MAGKAKQQAATSEGSKKGKSPILPLIVVLIAGLGGGVFVGKTFLAPKAPPAPKPPTVGKTLDLGEFIVNLGDESYLKAGVALGLKEGIDPKKLESEIAPLRDAALMAFAGKTPSQLNSLEGKYKVKEEIRERVNEVLEHKTHEKESVLEVYFTHFVTQ
ncbi:MAG: flagellar basal body-associated FliL family protein [Armatimonadota bacterium]|nr:flagellar basal body-associated FliL family protein [Armatimonadota bacterium]